LPPHLTSLRLATRSGGPGSEAVRGRLDAGLGDSDQLLDARADGAELAVRAAAALVVSEGGSALLSGSPARLLARYATFTLVAAGRSELKRSLVQRFSHRRE
jgi:hypothetical protein